MKQIALKCREGVLEWRHTCPVNLRRRSLERAPAAIPAYEVDRCISYYVHLPRIRYIPLLADPSKKTESPPAIFRFTQMQYG